MPEPTRRTMVILRGDQTGQELLHGGLRVLDRAVGRLPLFFERCDVGPDSRGGPTIGYADEVIERATDRLDGWEAPG